VDDYGPSPAYSESELSSASTPARAGADAVFASALGLRLEPAPPEELLAFPADCRTAEVSPGGGSGIEFGPGRLTLNNSAVSAIRVVLARYSVDAWSVDLGTLPKGASLAVPADLSSRPWLLGLRGDRHGHVVVCVRPE
jgi:hypothetical protein